MTFDSAQLQRFQTFRHSFHLFDANRGCSRVCVGTDLKPQDCDGTVRDRLSAARKDAHVGVNLRSRAGKRFSRFLCRPAGGGPAAFSFEKLSGKNSRPLQGSWRLSGGRVQRDIDSNLFPRGKPRPTKRAVLAQTRATRRVTPRSKCFSRARLYNRTTFSEEYPLSALRVSTIKRARSTMAA